MDHGYKSLGKYSSARDSMLHFMCINEWANDHDGNVEAPTGYFWEITNGPTDVHIRNPEINSVFEEWFRQNPEVTDSEELRTELIGNFILTEDNRGFVSVYKCVDAFEQNARWGSLTQQYFDWEGED